MAVRALSRRSFVTVTALIIVLTVMVGLVSNFLVDHWTWVLLVALVTLTTSLIVVTVIAQRRTPGFQQDASKKFTEATESPGESRSKPGINPGVSINISSKGRMVTRNNVIAIGDVHNSQSVHIHRNGLIVVAVAALLADVVTTGIIRLVQVIPSTPQAATKYTGAVVESQSAPSPMSPAGPVGTGEGETQQFIPSMEEPPSPIPARTRLNVTPKAGPPGSTITIIGIGLPSSARVFVYIGLTMVSEEETDSSGGFNLVEQLGSGNTPMQTGLNISVRSARAQPPAVCS